MKKLKMLTAAILFTWVLSTLMVTSATAALTGEEFDIARENSGYKMIIPNFIEIKDVEIDVDGEKRTIKNVIVVETPVKDENGAYPIFEIRTTDKKAFKIDSYPGNSMEQLSNFDGEFVNGSLIYSPHFSLKRTLSEITKNDVISLDFMVLGKEGEFIEDFVDLNFQFVDKGTASSQSVTESTETTWENELYTTTYSEVTDTITGQQLSSNNLYAFDGEYDIVVVPAGTSLYITSKLETLRDVSISPVTLIDGKVEPAGGAMPTAQIEDGSFDMGTLNGVGAKYKVVLDIEGAKYYKIGAFDESYDVGKWTIIQIASAPPAPSVPSAWALADVEKAISYELTTETVVSNYQQDITREEFSELAVKLYEKLSGKSAVLPESNKFNDTENEEILKAYALGIVSGVSDTRFAPDSNITREQIAVMFYNTLKAADPALIEGTYTVDFADKAEISSWAQNAVAFTTSKEIIFGVGANKVNPKGNATREQAITLITRTFEKYQ